MSEHKFNHDAENIEEAVGLSIDDLQERVNRAANTNGEEVTRSETIEVISKEFNTVELAFMLDTVLETAKQLRQQLALAGMFLEATQGGGSDEA